jgi:hypothetical protein
MARKVRIQYPGAIYHVMSQGDRREAIFEDNEAREWLLQTLAEACQQTGWPVHGYRWRLAPTQTRRRLTAGAALCITQRTVSSPALHGM